MLFILWPIYLPGFMFLVLYSWLFIPGFVILVLYACFTLLDFPGFPFLDLYSWLYIPGFIFPVLYCWLIFLALYSWFYIPGLLTFSPWAPPGPDFPILGHPLKPIVFLRESRLVINIQPLGASRARFPYSGPPSKTYHFLKRKSASS